MRTLSIALGALAFLLPYRSADAATFTVSNCTDAGAGSFRQAITDANGSAGADTIVFTVACTGASRLVPGSSYPAITESVVIDACTAPGASCGGNGGLVAGNPLTLAVEIDGTGRGPDWFHVNGTNVTVRGLVIRSSSDVGIKVSRDGALIEFNYIGTNVAGSAAQGHAADGIRLVGADDAVIRDNLISGNGDAGIEITGGSLRNLVTNNIIGLNATQTAALPNAGDGIQVTDLASRDNAFLSNQMSGNGGLGIDLYERGTVAASGTPSTATYEAVSTLTFSHTVAAGSNRLLLVGISFNNNGNEVVDSVTWKDGLGDQQGLTRVGFVESVDDARVEIWSLVAPNLGTANIRVTFDQGLNDGGVVGALSFTGVDPATPLGTFVSNFAQSDAGPATVTATSAAGELVFDTVACETCTSLTVGGGQTERWNLVNNGTDFGAASTEPGAASVTMSWSLGSSDHWAIGAVPIRPAAVGGVTANDANDTDSGANDLQNFPVLTSAARSGGTTTVAGTLDTDLANTQFRIDVYSNTAVDPSGFGEGEYFLGSFIVTTDVNGDVTFSDSVTRCDPARGIITTTATALNAGSPTRTSEFSAPPGAPISGSCGPNVDLSVSKTDSPDPVQVSSTLTYTVTVTNNSATNAATNVRVVDTLPAGVSFVSASGTGWSCSESGGVVTCTLASLAASTTSAPITITVTAPVATGTITNTATVSADENDLTASNDIAFAQTTVAPPPTADMSLTKSDSPDPVALNGALVYTLAVNNGGPDPANNVTVTDTLPAGVSFVSASGTGWNCGFAAGTVTCTRTSQPLAVGAAPPITITVTAPGTDQVITNTASVTANEVDPASGNNNDSEATVVGSPQLADVGIVKVDSSDPVATSSSLSYQLRVANYGPTTATSLVVTDTLPAGVTFVSASGTGWACGESGGVVTCGLASLAVGTTSDITIQVTSPASAGSVTNTASVSAAQTDTFSGNDSDSETTTVEAPPPNGGLCYVIPDSTDELVTIERLAPHTLTVIGSLGVTDIESATFGLTEVSTDLFAVNDDGVNGMLGTIDLTTGAFTAIGAVGPGDGVRGTLSLADIDGLAVHAQRLELWGTAREGGGDVLIRIDPTTGAVVQDMFGAGNDYLAIDFQGAGGGAVCPAPIDDSDDLAISSTGRYFIQADDGGANQHLAEMELDANGIPTGRLLSCIPVVDTLGAQIDDMEGTNFDQFGVMWGTTGGGGAFPNQLWQIDPATGIGTHPSTGGTPGLPFGYSGDYESVDCRGVTGQSTANRIAGTVWFDSNGDTLLHPSESGWPNVVVRLYVDNNNDGQVDANDTLVQTTSTNANGDYGFTLLTGGNYVLDIDVTTLPSNTSLTTDNLERAVFAGVGFSEALNDFGFNSLTLAVISSFNVYPDAAGVVVEWTTSSEVGTLGFYLLRWDPDSRDWVRAYENLIPAAIGNPAGGQYRVVDSVWGSYYALIEIEGEGRERFHGPFVGQYHPETRRPPMRRQVESRRRRPSRWMRTRIEQRRRQMRLPDAQEAVSRSSRRYTNSTRAKIFVRDEALYRLTTDEIGQLLGLPEHRVRSMISRRQLDLSSRGEPVAWIPTPGGEGILFYGESIDSIYTRDNVYWLGQRRGSWMRPISSGPSGTSAYRSFRDTARFEQQRFAATLVSTDPESDYWYWDYVVAGNPSYGNKGFDLELDGVVPSGSRAELTIEVAGATSTAATSEHGLSVTVNGTKIGETYWDGANRHDATFAFSSNLLRNGTNRVEVRGQLASGVPFSIFYVDAFEIAYDRAFRAVGDRLRFRAPGSETVTVTGFSSPDVYLFDVTQPKQPLLVTDTRVVAGVDGTYHLSFRPRTDAAEYLATAAPATSVPHEARPDETSALRTSSGADYVVVAPRELRDGATRLAERRRAQGLSAMVALVEDIHDEFNDGISSPEAIREFLAHGYEKWTEPPRYAVLLGGGTFDYRDDMGLGANLVPPLMASTPNGLFASDNLFGDVDGDDWVPEIAVGRVPALTPQELDAYLDKVEAYEAQGPVRSSVLLADHPGSAGDFHADADWVARWLPPDYRRARIYLTGENIGDARARLFDELSAGAGWVNYIGHGGLDRFSSMGLFTSNDVSALDSRTLGIWLALTCTVARYEVPGFAPLAVQLLMEPEAGAVALWASTGLSINRHAVELNQAFYRAAFDDSQSLLGDAVLQALRDVAEKDAPEFMLRNYTILGDPALMMWR